MAEPRGSLEKLSATALAKKFGHTRRATWYALRELRDAGYLRIESPLRHGGRITMHAAKRPLVSTHSHFVRL